MTIPIRPAAPADIDAMAVLLLADAEARCALDPGLWKLDRDPLTKIRATLRTTMEAETPPFRQQWLVAESGGGIVGVTHSILLPVPPIYAGESGPPGLIMEDCATAESAPPEVRAALLSAAEADLIEAGAQIILASGVEGGDWQAAYAAQAYVPLTMYLAKSGLNDAPPQASVRPATEADVPQIVTSSAINRQILYDLRPDFWKPHHQADARFGAWMQRSLTLGDRDMFVSEAAGKVTGYAISQPATPLHFPVPHDITSVGVIDDFYHSALESPTHLEADDEVAELLDAAEAARKGRDDTAVLIVCPAAWQSKIALLEQSGYRTALTWFIKERA